MFGPLRKDCGEGGIINLPTTYRAAAATVREHLLCPHAGFLMHNIATEGNIGNHLCQQVYTAYISCDPMNRVASLYDLGPVTRWRTCVTQVPRVAYQR